jgi:hypothetical protein
VADVQATAYNSIQSALQQKQHATKGATTDDAGRIFQACCAAWIHANIVQILLPPQEAHTQAAGHVVPCWRDDSFGLEPRRAVDAQAPAISVCSVQRRSSFPARLSCQTDLCADTLFASGVYSHVQLQHEDKQGGRQARQKQCRQR